MTRDSLTVELDAIAAPQATTPKPSTFLVLLLGVVAPLAAITIELTTRICTETFFDPLPGPAHIALALTAPAAGAFMAWFLRNPAFRHRKMAGWSAGFAMAVSAVYVIALLPLLPVAVIAVLLAGLGLLPLTPVGAFISALRVRRWLNFEYPSARRSVWWGAASALCAFTVLEVPAALTDYGLHLASAPATRDRGIELLRSYGSRDELLASCYRRDRTGFGFWGVLAGKVFEADSALARIVYYSVTGDAFDQVPAPNPALLGWDEFAGSAKVGRPAGNLALAASRIDGSIDAGAALGYLEWTMTFRNPGLTPQEARAELELPSGGVVSRATLWVDGEEREAAFASRSQARTAYQSVVMARRDPLLVTTSGAGRVLVQCFPVPAGGEMKIRLGVTAPMERIAGRSYLTLPEFADRNFSISAKPAVWLDSKEPVRARGEIGPGFPIWVERASAFAWTPDPFEDGFAIRQREVRGPAARPKRVVVVVDGSRSLAPLTREVQDAVAAIPNARVLFAGDRVQTRLPLTPSGYAGGRDNTEALLEAHRGTGPGDAILWIHGPAPVLVEPADRLVQMRERRPVAALFTVEAHRGPNLLLREIGGLPGVRVVSRIGTLGEDIGRLAESWEQGESLLSRERIPVSSPLPPEARTSTHLARLWAAEEVERLRRARRVQDAVSLATRFQIVTPVSGAVALENDTQYKQNNLTPPPAGVVSTVPEPATWLLMASGLAALGASRLRLRQAR